MRLAIIRNMAGLVFDAVFQETHESTLNVTDNPVETGVVVSDHAYMSPLKLTISAGVSDVVLTKKNFDQFGGESSRSKKCYELLRTLQVSAVPFDVQTGLTLYHNMVITSLRTSQDKDTSGSLTFEAELREVIIADTQLVTYPPRASGPTSRQAGKKKDKGEQQGEQQSDAATKQSLASKLAGILGLLK